MSDDSRNPPASGTRRVARIVHDDLGNARVEWQEIPDDRTGSFARPVLEVDNLRVEPDKVSYPYGRKSRLEPPDKRTGNTSRTDLRKLSEWIKLKREMEERRKREEENE